jgi:hypothetical protein
MKLHGDASYASRRLRFGQPSAAFTAAITRAPSAVTSNTNPRRPISPTSPSMAETLQAPPRRRQPAARLRPEAAPHGPP